jgi:hypothetical protein
VLLPRAVIGRPFGASVTKIHILMQVLRSLRREFDPHHDTGRSGRAPADR